MNLMMVIAAILVNIINLHCLCNDATNDKVGTIPETDNLQMIPTSGWTTSIEAENSYNKKETYMQAHYCEKSSEHDESEGWKGKWRKNQNNRIESANTNTNRNIVKIEGDASNISIHNEKKVEEGIEESKMKSHIIVDNSSLLCMNLGMKANGFTSSLTLRTESVAKIIGCHFEVRSEISPFDLCGSRISLSNLTLRFWNAQQTQMPPLFSSQMSASKSHSANCVSVCSSCFSSFQMSSPPFLSSPFIESVSLTDLIFSNISTVPTRRGIHFDLGCGCSTLMNGCSFSSVCDVYDGGIIPSLNNPLASLTASNTSFVGCTRTGNVEFIGSKENPSKPGRQNETENGQNTFIWCEWNGSRATGESDSWSDGISSGGAIFMHNLGNGELSVLHCLFNNCFGFNRGGGIMCHGVKSVHIENNLFNSCTAQNQFGGGMYAYYITSCVRVSECEFQNCRANDAGGGLLLEIFQDFGAGCIGMENEDEKSVCVFDCSFSSCSLNGNSGGGICCQYVPNQFKMRNILFISCSANEYGGGLYFRPEKTKKPDDGFYCYFLFFHECRCRITSTPNGHDIIYYDQNNLYLSENNPFYECYTTNTDGQRMCYGYDLSNSGSWIFQLTEKKEWLNDWTKVLFVGVNGDDSNGLCGMGESVPCKTVGHAVETGLEELSSSVTLLEGNHQSETATIDIGEKKISIIGKGRRLSLIGTGALSSTGALFSVSTGHLGLLHMKVDCNSIAETSPSVVAVSDWSGSLSLEDVVISSSVAGTNVISSSVFVVALSQLRMIDVEIKDMKVSQPLFSEPSSGEAESDESFLSNVTIRNVNLTEGDGVVVAKNVNGEETFVVSNTTIEQCVCEDGNGGGIYVCLQGNGKVVVNGTSLIDGCVAMGIEGNGGRGGGLFVVMDSGGCGLTIGENVEFSKVNENVASYGKDVFVHCGSGVFLESKVNTNTFAFFDRSALPSDVLKLSGSENGDESGVIPLFVYLCTMGTKIIVDGSGGNGMDHNRCGFEGFGCLTVDYCANSRMSDISKEIEVASSSSIKDEIEISSIGVIISGRIISSSSDEGEKIQVNVSDGGSATLDCLVGCSSSLTMRRLSFVVKGPLNSRRSAFIHSTSTLSVTNCSVSFENGALTSGMIGYYVINIEGGELIMNGFVMESSVTMNGKSPITMTSGAQLEILNSKVSGVEVEGGNGGGCLNVEMKEGGNVNIEEFNLSSTCSDGSGMKGGGMMISLGKGGSLEMKNVNLSECEVPSEDIEDGGRGIGGGIFVELPDQMGSFVMEGMEFEGCDAWKGKNMFVSGWDLREIVNKEHLKWEIKEEELGSLDELRGWERKTTGEEGYVIPLVVYLWRNWSGNGFVSREKGGDFSGCGYSEVPCSSVDHLISLRYEPLGEGESHIKIVGSGLLQKSISFLSSSSLSITPVVSIEGENEETNLKVSKEGRNEGEEEEGGMITSNVVVSFTNLSFSLPNELVSHSSLIQSLSSSATSLSIKRCSFVCEDSTKETKYCLIKADGGSVVIEDCTLSQFNLAKGFVEFTADVKSIDVMNVSVSNTTISESSLISLSQPSPTNVLINKARENAKQIVRVNSSSFANITCVENRACVMSVGSFLNGMECVIEGCVLTKCMSERSLEGGGMKMLMKRGESEVKVSGCSFGMCVCSTGNGRGGGMMIDALDPNGECSNTEMPPLGLRLENIRFMMNDAFVGKDVFIRCDSIDLQLNERLFGLDFSQEALKGKDSMCGSDGEGKVDVDLMPLITFYYSSQVFVCVNGSDNRQCGAQNNPCESIGNAVLHIQRSMMNVLWIDGEGMMGEECVIGDVRMVSMGREKATVHFEGKMEERGEERSMMVFVNESVVERCLFVFGEMFESTQKYVVKVKEGRMVMNECSFEGSASGMGKMLKNTLVGVEGGEMEMVRCTIRRIHHCGRLVVFCGESSRVIMSETRIWDVESEGDVVVVEGEARVSVKEVEMENITIIGEWSVMGMRGCGDGNLSNCTFSGCESGREKGGVVWLSNCEDVRIEMCDVCGGVNRADEERKFMEMNEKEEKEGRERICKWNGSMVGVERSRVMMKDTRIRESGKGGLSVSRGSVTIEKGEFENNNPFIEKYPSVRRNILCSDSGILTISSLKGGDGQEKNTSLWILNDGCTLGGIAGERSSPFFIPKLEEVSISENDRDVVVKFKGSLFVPCDLSFKLVYKTGDVELVETYPFEEDGFVSETEVIGRISSENISAIADETEVSVMILFGKPFAETSPQILKNRSESKVNGDEKVVKGGKEGKSYWLLIVIVLVIMFLIVLIVSVVLAVRWRKAKNEAKDLREIVNDNIRKDPKAFEMVTMEMSPEEQWRRAEREAEKKNEEKMKKRVYAKSLGHSESSEHLLSESGSTEYILGRDSDKIPDWTLEKVEEEEIRKRSPSPSISSTSTTDTDSTFVRREELCPTTSSMSNLVDAMACSSPHEKLIVDLRDSLFMLLHGRNKTKEMAIGSLQEREQTAAQILFWVANGALHSFDEMENELSSLANLSPHIVLFSEHMVICIALHSDCSSDSDTSSISSASTMVTSSSDVSVKSERFTKSPFPSSAFEEDDDFKKECLRWKAPELLINKKMGATKESVVFSIGMMLWECLTLDIPFGEYDAETAGQKITFGERPSRKMIAGRGMDEVVGSCWEEEASKRMGLFEVKKELFSHFPANAAVVTASDAIAYAESSESESDDEKEGKDIHQSTTTNTSTTTSSTVSSTATSKTRENERSG
ncbi:uncharacterized protein MONOS_2854 [Monocercomonoides exilis]|uniref:uncharacterized protein n=1 Tax=Monocercomonoides exilis TaxID=2049356 RepID=UPI00355A46E5|nr:hypothetical protein MONOS_2854 [Monocercomonoides exilis]|eukprot:MONOS_2854.1-p1 / transcript=MONOS_2854.1 / gene=MONOS_2854 / organism=Monocercomonoides_exilis_PA203 / gene_product=unspecified product / transcript_product=unspecified product / location=Mono_scaffold00062:9986-18199(-) / protein_length=2737 / sequence_SO=supercontig / SO=protein_coding / is_pseudo=false